MGSDGGGDALLFAEALLGFAGEGLGAASLGAALLGLGGFLPAQE